MGDIFPLWRELHHGSPGRRLTHQPLLTDQVRVSVAYHNPKKAVDDLEAVRHLTALTGDLG